MNSQKPLIIQSDRTLMLEVGQPGYVECRDFLVLFAELVKSPEFIHTYRVTPLSLWNAAALGVQFNGIVEGLEAFSRYGIPSNVIVDMKEWYDTYGKLVLQKIAQDRLELEVKDSRILERILNNKSLEHFWVENKGQAGLFIPEMKRGDLKHALIKAGYPVKLSRTCADIWMENGSISLCAALTLTASRLNSAIIKKKP